MINKITSQILLRIHCNQLQTIKSAFCISASISSLKFNYQKTGIRAELKITISIVIAVHRESVRQKVQTNKFLTSKDGHSHLIPLTHCIGIECRIVIVSTFAKFIHKVNLVSDDIKSSH